MSTIEERVAKGAALMDEKVPGWERKIDTASLDMGQCPRCVIGQVLGINETLPYLYQMSEFAEKCQSLGLEFGGYDDNGIEDHGFDVSDDDDEYAVLGTAWLAEIARRLNSTTEATS